MRVFSTHVPGAIALCACAFACATLSQSIVESHQETFESLLNRAGELLDGSTSVVDRRGNPAAARELIQRAIAGARTRNDGTALGRALAFEVRAASAAGDYDAGQQAATEALRATLSDVQRAEVKASLEWFRYLQHSPHPFAYKYDEEIRVRLPVMPEVPPFSHAPEPPPSPAAVNPFNFARLMSSTTTLTLSRTGGDMTARMLELLGPQVHPACASAAACGWDEIFTGHLLNAAGRPDEAAERWSKAADDVEGRDPILAAIARIFEGDALAAPLSSPLELNLMVMNPLPSSLSLSAGIEVAELKPVEPARLDQARIRYERARSLLTGNRCPRCSADLDARGAYLTFAAGGIEPAAEEFARVARRYESLGDLAYARFAAATAVGAAMLGRDSQAARTGAEALADDLRGAPFPGAAIAAVRLLTRVAFYLERGRGDARAAEQAFDLALLISDRTGITQVGGEVAIQKAELLIRMGRRHEALLLKRRAREATEIYLAMVPKITFFQTTNGVEEELASKRQQLFAEVYGDQAAFFSEGDIPHAREANELMARLLREGIGPMPLPQPDLVAQNEVSLLLAQNRIDEAIAAARNVSDPLLLAAAHLLAGQHREAAAIARRQAMDAIDAIPGSAAGAPGLNNLRLQLVRSVIQRAVDVLTSANAAADAQEVLETLRKKSPVERPGAEWLYADPGRPWLRDVAEAAIAEGLGRLPDAEARLIRARAAIAQAGATIGPLHAREGFDADSAAVDRSYVRVLARQGRATDALLALEMSRGRVYHQQLATAGALGGNREQDAALRSWWQAEAELRGLRLRAIAGEQIPTAQLASAEAAVADLGQRITRDAPGVATMVTEDAVDATLLTAVRRKLARGPASVLVAYFVSGDDVFAWVLNSTAEPQLRKLPVTGRDLRDASVVLYNRLSTPQPEWEDAARKLYGALIGPLEQLLPAANGIRPRPRLGILPHAGTNLLPFAALLDASGTPLVRRFDIFYSPSLRTYARSSDQPRALGRQVEAFGFNGETLLFAEDEARSIARPPHVHVGSAATRAAILAAAQRVPVLHLATHTMLDEANPFAARLFVADGALTLAEMLGVRWRARLVTLSACETAAGRLTAAEEFTGISRAVLAAGVPTVLITMWRIDDESTAQLMQRFYRQLAAGADAAAALAEAQRASLTRGGDSAHPAFWAPFIVVGADR